MTYFVWAVLLVLQNAAFTMTSRARNSGSDAYHALAAVFSNGFWILNIIAIYVAATVFGSVFMAKLLRRYVERGNRRVGVYNEGEGGADLRDSEERDTRPEDHCPMCDHTPVAIMHGCPECGQKWLRGGDMDAWRKVEEGSDAPDGLPRESQAEYFGRAR